MVQEAEITTPFCKRILGGYTLGWLDHADEGLKFNVTHIQQDNHGGITGEVSVWYDWMSQEKPTLSSVRLNLLATRSRNDIAAKLAKLKPDFPWQKIVEQVCHEVIEAYRAGDPGCELEVFEGNESTRVVPQYALDPLVLKGVPSIIYGDKGCHKTTLSLTAAACMLTDWHDNPFGFSLNGQAYRTALLDYESNQDLTIYTLQRIRKGCDIPYFSLFYRHCTAPLADDVEAVAKFLADHKIDVAIIDSLGAACGGDLFKPEPALRFFEALRQLRTTGCATSLIIAQNSKGEEGKKTIFGTTFFTYYARNIFEVKKYGNFDEKVESYVALINTENNYTAKHDPMGFHLTYPAGAIKIESTHVTLAQLTEKANVQNKITAVLREANGEMSLEDLCRAVGTGKDTLSVLLNKLKNKGLVTSTKRGVWSLVYES